MQFISEVEGEFINIVELDEKTFRMMLFQNVLKKHESLVCDILKDIWSEEFMKVLEVNVVGTFLVTKYLCNNVTNTIVNVSSTDSEDTYSLLNIDYSSSKAAVNIITKTFALKLKKIKVIGVMPNWTNTESIKEMNQDYLKEEMNRIGQEKLEEPNIVASNIVDLIFNETVISGDIRRV